MSFEPDTTSLIETVLPAFAQEIVALLAAAERSNLASQVRNLRIVDRCRCGQEDCSHFYTAQKPQGAYGPGHSNLVLDTTSGMVVLDIVDGVIVAIEVLDRPDVKALLDLYLPATSGDAAG